MEKRCAKPHQPRSKDLKTAGAAVARAVAAMPQPRRFAVVLSNSGASEAVAVPKALRGGERVLSSRAHRFDELAELGDLDTNGGPAANLAAANDANAGAAANANAGAGGAANLDAAAGANASAGAGGAANLDADA